MQAKKQDEVQKVLRDQLKTAKKKNQGNILNISSIYGVIAPKFEIYDHTLMTTPIEYVAVKSALIHLTKYIASYVNDSRFRMNCVSPGGIFDNQPKNFVKNYSKRVPLGRMANPDDIAPAISFLISDESKYISGQNLIIDGGWTSI